MSGEQVSYTMTLDDLLSPKIEEADKKTKSFHGTLNSLSEGAASIGKALGLSLNLDQVIDFVKSSTEMVEQLHQADARLKAGMISSNNAAGLSYDELKKSADTFSQTLPYTKVQVVDMQSQLVAFPAVNRKIFDEASMAAMDMATHLHRGLDETSMAVGKALQDPVKGMASLRDMGVSFNQTQTEMIERLMATGQSGKAQAIVLNQLQTAFAGSAKAAADADPLFKYNKTMEDIKEHVGETGEALLSDLAPALEAMANGFKTAFDVVSGWVNYLNYHVKPIVKEVEGDIEALGIGVVVAAIGWAIANPMVFAYTGALVANGIASAGLAVASGVLTAAQWALNLAMNANPVGIIVIAIGALVTGFILAYQHSEKFRAVLAGLGEIGKDIGVIFKGTGEMILGAMTLNPAEIQKGFEDMAGAASDIGSAFHRGYTSSMAASALEDAKEKKDQKKHQSTMGGLIDDHKIKPPKDNKTDHYDGAGVGKATGSKATTINIHINQLGCGLTIKTTNVMETMSRIHDHVTNALTGAVNDSQTVAGDD